MAITTIGIVSASATHLEFGLGNRNEVNYPNLEIQYSSRPDFQFGIAPIVTVANLSPVTLSPLNQGNTYWVRFREKNSAGVYNGGWTAPFAAYTPIANAQVTAPLSVMVQPAIIVAPQPVTWYGVPEEAAYPASNLNTDSPAEQMQWTGGAFNQVRFETSGAPFDTIAVLGTNFPAGTTWGIQTYDTRAAMEAATGHVFEQGPVQFHASPNLPGRPAYHGLLRLAAPRTERFGRLYWQAASPPAARIVLTYAVIGRARTAKNIAADKVETPMEMGSLDRLRDGTPDRRLGFRGRRVEFEIALMTEAQWETQFSDLRQRIGLIDPVLVVPNTRANAFLHDRILFGPMQSLRASQPYTPRFSQQFAVESLI